MPTTKKAVTALVAEGAQAGTAARSGAGPRIRIAVKMTTVMIMAMITRMTNIPMIMAKITQAAARERAARISAVAAMSRALPVSGAAGRWKTGF